MIRQRSVLLACDLDSQVFGVLPLALAFAARGWRTTFAIESVRSLPPELLERLMGQFRVVERSVSVLPTEHEIFDHDAIGVFVNGSRLALFRHMLDLAAQVRELPRPAIFCGFNGLVFEKFEEGIAWRLGYDVIALNGPRDRDAFVDFLHATEFAEQPSVIVGLRRKTDRPQMPMRTPAPVASAERERSVSAAPPPEAADASRPAEGPDDPSAPENPSGAIAASPDVRSVEPAVSLSTSRKLFVFAEQVVVPRGLRERQTLVATLSRLAGASPDWTVALKARVRPNEKTFHAQPNHIETLVAAVKRRPPNFTVTYEPLDQLLERADLFATISSTALFDAFDHGTPSLVVTDFGLRNADGAHVFFASGLLCRLSDLASLDEAPTLAPDERWIRRMGYGDPFSPSALIDWLEAFDPNRPMPKAFVSFPAAVAVAIGAGEKAAATLEAWRRVKDAIGGTVTIPDDGLAGQRPDQPKTAAAALGLLGFAIAKALSPNGDGEVAKLAKTARVPVAASDERYEGPITALSREFGVYWIIKRARLRLGLPIHKRRE